MKSLVKTPPAEEKLRQANAKLLEKLKQLSPEQEQLRTRGNEGWALLRRELVPEWDTIVAEIRAWEKTQLVDRLLTLHPDINDKIAMIILRKRQGTNEQKGN